MTDQLSTYPTTQEENVISIIEGAPSLTLDGPVKFNDEITLCNGATVAGGTVDVGNQVVNNVPDPLLAQDPVTLNYFNTNVPADTSGYDTMTLIPDDTLPFGRPFPINGGDGDDPGQGEEYDNPRMILVGMGSTYFAGEWTRAHLVIRGRNVLGGLGGFTFRSVLNNVPSPSGVAQNGTDISYDPNTGDVTINRTGIYAFGLEVTSRTLSTIALPSLAHLTWGFGRNAPAGNQPGSTGLITGCGGDGLAAALWAHVSFTTMGLFVGGERISLWVNIHSANAAPPAVQNVGIQLGVYHAFVTRIR